MSIKKQHKVIKKQGQNHFLIKFLIPIILIKKIRKFQLKILFQLHLKAKKIKFRFYLNKNQQKIIIVLKLKIIFTIILNKILTILITNILKIKVLIILILMNSITKQINYFKIILI
jgi:hypothetical protein